MVSEAPHRRSGADAFPLKRLAGFGTGTFQRKRVSLDARPDAASRALP
jgi:hypothetical protein